MADRYTQANLALLASVADGGGTQTLTADELAALRNDDAATVAATVAAGQTAIAEFDLGRIHRTAGEQVRVYTDVHDQGGFLVVKTKETSGAAWNTVLSGITKASYTPTNVYGTQVKTCISTVAIAEDGYLNSITCRMRRSTYSSTTVVAMVWRLVSGSTYSLVCVRAKGFPAGDQIQNVEFSFGAGMLGSPVKKGDVIATWNEYGTSSYQTWLCSHKAAGASPTADDSVATYNGYAGNGGVGSSAEFAPGNNTITNYNIAYSLTPYYPRVADLDGATRYVQVTIDNSGGSAAADLNEVQIYGEINSATRLRFVDGGGSPITQIDLGAVAQTRASAWALLGYAKNEGATTIGNAVIGLVPDLDQLSSNDEAAWWSVYLATSGAGAGACGHCSHNGGATCAQSRAEFRTVDCRAATGDGADGGCPEYTPTTLTLGDIAAGATVPVYGRVYCADGEAVGNRYAVALSFGVRE